MQNKPNLPDAQMNVNNVLTKDCENKTLGEHGKNKPNSNPIQTQYKANTNPIPEMSEIAVTLVKTRNYNNEQRTMSYELFSKQTQSKPISKAKKCCCV